MAVIGIVAGAVYLLRGGEPPADKATVAVEEAPARPSPPAPGNPAPPAPPTPGAQPSPGPPAPSAPAAAVDASAARPLPLPSDAGTRTAPIGAVAYQAEQMEMLRQLVETDPQKAVDLARLANRRFPKSPDAPERSWVVVKGLANLKRFHDARDEAKAMVAKYPDNHFARDAERHLMVYPLDQPSREDMQAQEKK